MKIFLIGGTGLVGSYLMPAMISKGYKIYALTRKESRAEKIRLLGAIPVTGDIRDITTFIDKLEEIPDVIILLAMPSVRPGKRMTKKIKEELKQETNDFFRNALGLGIRFGIPVILPGGTSFRTRGNEVADESWPILREGLTEIGTDTDEMVSEAIRTGKPHVIQLIYGKIYGNGGLFRFIFNMAQRGKMGVIGKGDNCIPNVHAEDAASAIILATEKLPAGEKFIIADDTPASQYEFTVYMSHLLGGRKPGHIPSFLARLILGRDFYTIVTMNCRVNNEKAKKILGWHPKYPSYKEGLNVTIPEMKEKKNYFDT